MLLQLILALLLIALGLIIHYYGENAVAGVPLILLTNPGIAIFLSFFVEFFKFKKDVFYVLIYLVLVFALDLLVYYKFDILLKTGVAWIIFAVVGSITTLISYLFHIVYQTFDKTSKNKTQC